MTAAEQFAEWRAEIATELQETQERLAAERAKLQPAESTYGEAKAAWAALNVFANAGLGLSRAMPLLLHSRLSNAREAFTTAQGVRAAIQASIKALGQRVDELQDAINHIDRALTADKVTQLRPVAESSRRKPQPVDFDNILMPAGAAR